MFRHAILAFLALAVSSCSTSSEFIPVVKVDDDLVEKPELLNDSLRKNIAQVLTYYGEDWQADDDRLLVSITDRELLWNYTTKAMDYDWLSSHRAPEEDR